MQVIATIGLCLLCKLLSSLFALSRGDRDRAGDLGLGSDPGQGDRAGQRVVCRVFGQGLGLRRVWGLPGTLSVRRGDHYQDARGGGAVRGGGSIESKQTLTGVG